MFINRLLKRHFNLSSITGNHEKRRQLIIYFYRSIPADNCYINSMKRQKGMTLKDELPRSVGVQYATGEEWRNNSRKNEEGAKAKTTPSCGCNGVMEVKSNAVKSNIA